MKISKKNDCDGAVLNCAERYCLGRYTYMPTLVLDVIRPILKDCSDKTLWCFEKDISDWIHSQINTEDAACLQEWTNFLSLVKQEIQNRDWEKELCKR